jgi:hypothetical protein
MTCKLCNTDNLLNPKQFAGNTVCSECYDEVSGSNSDTEQQNPTADRANNTVKITGENLPTNNILEEVVEFFYQQNTTETKSHFSDRFPEEQIEKYRLGWAPPDNSLYTYLTEQGYSDKEILSTGVFSEQNDGSLSCLWQGRYVYPYFNSNMEPAYMIARSTGSKGGGAAGYDGHKKDFLAGKYAKMAHTKEYCPYTEPIWGLNTLDRSTERVIVAEGIADAIQADAYGFPVISPVTTQFKEKHFEEVQEIIQKFDISEVYLVPDSEDPSEDMKKKYGESAVGEGLTGAIIMSHKMEDSISASLHITTLPRKSERSKIDLDEFLKENSADEFESVLDSHQTQQPEEYNFYKLYEEEKVSTTSYDTETMASTDKEFYSVDLLDVTPPQISAGYRGENPIEHRGDSKNYFIVKGSGSDVIAYDHKSKQTYNALTYLLHKLGLREGHSVEGGLTPKETYQLYNYMLENDIISETAEIPSKAMKYISKTQFEYSSPEVPVDVYYATVHYIQNETQYTLSDADTDYYTDEYFQMLPSFITNPQTIYDIITTSDKYTLPDELSAITFRDITDEKSVWTTSELDDEYDTVTLVALAVDLLDYNELHKYANHTLTDQEYYDICETILTIAPFFSVENLPLKLLRHVAVTTDEFNYTDSDMTTTTRKQLTSYIQDQVYQN